MYLAICTHGHNVNRTLCTPSFFLFPADLDPDCFTLQFTKISPEKKISLIVKEITVLFVTVILSGKQLGSQINYSSSDLNTDYVLLPAGYTYQNKGLLNFNTFDHCLIRYSIFCLFIVRKLRAIR